AVGERLHSPGPDGPSQHTIDLVERRTAGALAGLAAPAFGERAEGGAHSSRLDQRGGRTRWLRRRAAGEQGRALLVHDLRGGEPLHEALEAGDGVEANAESRVVGVHE